MEKFRQLQLSLGSIEHFGASTMQFIHQRMQVQVLTTMTTSSGVPADCLRATRCAGLARKCKAYTAAVLTSSQPDCRLMDGCLQSTRSDDLHTNCCLKGLWGFQTLCLGSNCSMLDQSAARSYELCCC